MNNFYRIPAINRYYRITKFYSFLHQLSINGAFYTLLAGIIIIATDRYIIDIEGIIISMVQNYSKFFVYSLFLISETLMGVIPPEIFIAWSAKSMNPWLSLFFIASLSYIGGILAYFLGTQLFKIKKIKTYFEQKIAIHITNLRKWGGLLVFVGAMLPIPHSMVSFACGVISYNFTSYLLWALFRFLRFFIYGVAIFEFLK